MRNIQAFISGESRDCDGKHYSEAEYDMTDEEKTEQFGDLNFFDRIMTYMVSTHSEEGTLSVRQDENGLPIFEWSERTEEGYRASHAHFEKGEGHED